MKSKLTQTRLKELLRYDPEAGVFTWLVRKKGTRGKGSIAGCIEKEEGYRIIKIDYIGYRASRLAWLYMVGYLPENDMDHINRIRHDDRIKNLRPVSKSCNARNRSVKKGTSSGIKGVSRRKGDRQWTAYIYIPARVCLGRHNSKLDAAKARHTGEVKYGFPNCDAGSSALEYIKKYENLQL